MGKYVANPVEVDAFKITEVMQVSQVKKQVIRPGEIIQMEPIGFSLTLENGGKVYATPEMCSRMTPQEGDYWVIQSDGYKYLNPKEVFERKYRLQKES